MDHDQRFKSLIREFFGDFLRLFFVEWAERLDLSNVEWLDKELLPDPPEGARYHLDLVARVPTLLPVEGSDPEGWLALVHIEIESADKTTSIKPRLARYYIHLRDRYELPVLPIVIFLKVGLDGIGVDTFSERFWELETLSFQYLYVGLPGLDGLQYAAGDNWLGVALSALMKIPKDKVAELGKEALTKLAKSPLDRHKIFYWANASKHTCRSRRNSAARSSNFSQKFQ